MSEATHVKMEPISFQATATKTVHLGMLTQEINAYRICFNLIKLDCRTLAAHGHLETGDGAKAVETAEVITAKRAKYVCQT